MDFQGVFLFHGFSRRNIKVKSSLDDFFLCFSMCSSWCVFLGVFLVCFLGVFFLKCFLGVFVYMCFPRCVFLGVFVYVLFSGGLRRHRSNDRSWKVCRDHVRRLR